MNRPKAIQYFMTYHAMKVLSLALPLIAVIYCIKAQSVSLRTPDQRGYRYFSQNAFEASSASFEDPAWQAASLFRQGEFKQAAGIYAGDTSAHGHFNQGNSLVMMGKYEQAIEKFEKALTLKPRWEPAEINLKIARARAKMLEKKGGDMTGGKMAADDIVFDKNMNNKNTDQTETDEGGPMSESEIRAMWLRQAKTRPADFLRQKFAYQEATKSTSKSIKASSSTAKNDKNSVSNRQPEKQPIKQSEPEQ